MKDTRKNHKQTIVVDDAGSVPVVASLADAVSASAYIYSPDGVRMCPVKEWYALSLDERARIREEVMGY